MIILLIGQLFGTVSTREANPTVYLSSTDGSTHTHVHTPHIHTHHKDTTHTQIHAPHTQIHAHTPHTQIHAHTPHTQIHTHTHKYTHKYTHTYTYTQIDTHTTHKYTHNPEIDLLSTADDNIYYLTLTLQL